jgi:hypothetical protein
LRGAGAFDPPWTTPLEHVIIVVMENRTMDNVFSGFPGADTASSVLAHDGTWPRNSSLRIGCSPGIAARVIPDISTSPQRARAS